MLSIQEGNTISFRYTNWKNETTKRKAVFTNISYGSTEYHPEIQWLLEAYDLDKREKRIFAMKDMNNIELIKESTRYV